ncbi:unnamed protein product [Urochloa humidicola]
MDAHGALDSLLGRLTSILVNEAQLLGHVRGDVEFIKDEMECMNSLILQLTEAQHRDHLVRAWMKQVVGLTRDCEGNVEHYIHYVSGRPSNDGLLGHLRRIAQFLHTMPVRHRIAKRIKELKVRARDVGDRRQRYGVTVPLASATASADMYDGDAEAAGDEKELQRRAAVFDGVEPPADDELIVQQGIDDLMKWLDREAPPVASGASRDDGKPQVRVFSVAGYPLASQVAKGVYQHPLVSTLFGCKALVDLWTYNDARTTLAKIVEEITGAQPDQGDELISNKEGESSTETLSICKGKKQLASKLQVHLSGKRFLIIVTRVYNEIEKERKHLLDALLHAADGCHPGSAIIMDTRSIEVALSLSPYKIISARRLPEFFCDKAEKLGANEFFLPMFFDELCDSSVFARKMFLHLQYANPVTTEKEADMQHHAISKCLLLNKSIAQKMVMWCYNELPSKYRSCLLYLAIFPMGHVIKTTSLARRWIAEGLITTATRSNKTESAADEAEHYWDVLFTRGFISPLEISAAGNIKSCTVHHEVHKVIVKIARDVNITETNLRTDWAHRLSIHNRIGLQKSHSAGDSRDFAASLLSLAASPEWKLLKVLDLEGCQGLEKTHLKSICKILLLKYLSLRNTDVTELPKQIKELQCLETLDIRQTKVRVLAKKPVVLPQLKHFLAGHKVSASEDTMTSEESIATVSMPLGIQKMENLEILSHVEVTDRDSELAGIAQLLRLRKLGVALHGKSIKLSDLFCQVEKLHKCLRSLSIRMSSSPEGSENHDAEEVEALRFLPQFIERLNICGINNGFVYSIKEHHRLAKITLSETYLTEDGLSILGNLGALRGLKLQHKSYTESELFFKKCKFQSLTYLLVDSKEITRIRFAIGSAPKLQRIVWTFETMDALSGIDWLPRLKKLVLNGDCVLDPIKEALEGHPSGAILEHKPQQQGPAE